MYFNYYAFAFTCCFIFQSSSQDGKSKEDIDYQDYRNEYDSHTFVALIDIVFADGTKRSCTGSIIHDNVVITAAHCFLHEYDENIRPELSVSFVVIGSKKMFETGYEQYLPIERILVHPNYRGWTADLALIYTFAGMTSDKPGKVIPLAGERVSNPVDSNMTVFSWGHCRVEEVAQPWKQNIIPKTPCPETGSNEDVNNVRRFTAALLPKRARREQDQLPVRYPESSKEALRQKQRFQTEFKKKRKDLLDDYPILQQKVRDKVPTMATAKKQRTITTKRLSRYLTSKEDANGPNYNRGYRSNRSSTFRPHNTNMGFDFHLRGRVISKGSQESHSKFKNFYKNWRRSMGTQQNKLTVEIFGFVNIATCKKIVEGALPPRYEIKNGEVACYSSEEHYLTDEDSGAPAVRHGQLVAVTVGGAQCDGDQVGVGMMMSCYCNWIADNLPGGGTEMNCCKNCCDVNKHSEDSPSRTSHRNKFL